MSNDTTEPDAKRKKTEMEIARNTVLFFKSPKDGSSKDPYVEELKTLGLFGVCYPALSFNYINLDEINSALQRPDDFSAIIITSQNGVKGLEKAIESPSISQVWKENYVFGWQKKSTFVVGPATADAVRALGLNPVGEESGNAEKLFPLLEKSLSRGCKPVLYPCGNLAREVLPNQMKQAGLDLHSITVYETCADYNLKENLTSFTNKHQGYPEYIVYYSPSGVTYTKDVLTQIGVPLHDTKLIAIGPTTEAALQKRGFEHIATAAKPTPSHVVQAIKTFLEVQDD